MTSDSYLTISEPSSGIYKEKSSKFLSFAYPVTSEAEIRTWLQQTRKEYYDARHVCYAYILGASQSAYNASDGGEPAHTAGDRSDIVQFPFGINVDSCFRSANNWLLLKQFLFH